MSKAVPEVQEVKLDQLSTVSGGASMTEYALFKPSVPPSTRQPQLQEVKLDRLAAVTGGANMVEYII